MWYKGLVEVLTSLRYRYLMKNKSLEQLPYLVQSLVQVLNVHQDCSTDTKCGTSLRYRKKSLVLVLNLLEVLNAGSNPGRSL